MKKEEREYIQYIEDIELSLNRILNYTKDLGFNEFVNDYKTIDAVIRNFEIIGEASKNIPEEIKTKYSEVPWDQMYRFRNKVTHEYFGVDYEIIWEIIKNYLPDDLAQIKEVIKSERR